MSERMNFGSFGEEIQFNVPENAFDATNPESALPGEVGSSATTSGCHTEGCSDNTACKDLC